MITSAQTTFRHMAPSDAVTARIQSEAEKLNQYFDGITSCRVMIAAPSHHHQQGEPFHIRIELGVPGKELVVSHEPGARAAAGKGPGDEQGHAHHESEAPHQDAYLAIRDGFKAMRRQLQDYVDCLRHH